MLRPQTTLYLFGALFSLGLAVSLKRFMWRFERAGGGPREQAIYRWGKASFGPLLVGTVLMALMAWASIP